MYLVNGNNKSVVRHVDDKEHDKIKALKMNGYIERNEDGTLKNEIMDKKLLDVTEKMKNNVKNILMMIDEAELMKIAENQKIKLTQKETKDSIVSKIIDEM